METLVIICLAVIVIGVVILIIDLVVTKKQIKELEDVIDSWIWQDASPPAAEDDSEEFVDGYYDVNAFRKRMAGIRTNYIDEELFGDIPLHTPVDSKDENSAGVEIITEDLELHIDNLARRR